MKKMMIYLLAGLFTKLPSDVLNKFKIFFDFCLQRQHQESHLVRIFFYLC